MSADHRCVKEPWRNFKKGIVDANPHSRKDHMCMDRRIIETEQAPEQPFDPFHIYGLPESVNGGGRVLIRFPSLKTEQWFLDNSEELCVPGTHVTSKRNEKNSKTLLPQSVRKTLRPRPCSSMDSWSNWVFLLHSVSKQLCKVMVIYL